MKPQRGKGDPGVRILVVESDRPIRELLREFLGIAGHDPTSVSNSREALVLMEHNQSPFHRIAGQAH